MKKRMVLMLGICMGVATVGASEWYAKEIEPLNKRISALSKEIGEKDKQLRANPDNKALAATVDKLKKEYAEMRKLKKDILIAHGVQMGDEYHQ